MKHDVTFNIPTRSLGNADIEFFVFRKGEMFGKLAVSKGSIVWFQRNKVWGHKANWEDLDKYMTKAHPRVERRK
jgi:hypothetical protein